MATRSKGLRLEDLPENIRRQVEEQEQGLSKGLAQESMHWSKEAKRGFKIMYLWLIATALLIWWFIRTTAVIVRWFGRKIIRLMKWIFVARTVQKVVN